MHRVPERTDARVVRAASAALLLVLAGCPLTERGLLAPPTGRAEDLTEKVARLERTVDELRAAPPSVPADTGQRLENLGRGVADLRPQLEDASRRLAKLDGRVEVLERATSSTKEAARLDDLEGRFSVLEKRVAQLSSEIKEMAAAKAAMAPVLAPPAERGAPPAPAVEKVTTPQSLYDEAYTLYKKQGKYEEARAKFRAFVDADPNGALAPNAIFWIGETLFDQKQYEQAILEYDRVVQKYPKSGKVPSALLKEAFAFDSIGDPEDARILLKKIVREFPNSDQATLAKKKLEALGE
ncbi:MAG: tol-pal system protein YbgF [Deltaproteobacteria bacterium]|nr:tol-pal system protein YbgF [Deltaproteobacteria bacterium]